jgi:FkbM family methyltransferase
MNLKTPYSLLTQSGPCIGGLFKRYEGSLVKARTQLLFKHRFDPFVTRDGYKIENTQQLYCYWDFAWEAIVFRGGWPEQMPENPVILDLGANYGIFGWLCRKRWPKATLIGFEPIPDLAKYCERLGCYDRIFPIALSESNGIATLFLDHSLGLTASLGGNELLNFTAGQIKVETRRLDELDLRPDFMKVDVDGGELKTIMGGFKTFSTCRFSVIECVGKQRHKTIQDILQKQCRKLYCMGVDYLFYDE